jgi:hypothetical protein
LSKNPRAPCVSIDFHSCKYPTYKFIVINHDSWHARKGLTGINDVRSIAFKTLAKFSPGTRFVYGSLHFVANRLGDLSMQEPEQQES